MHCSDDMQLNKQNVCMFIDCKDIFKIAWLHHKMCNIKGNDSTVKQ